MSMGQRLVSIGLLFVSCALPAPAFAAGWAWNHPGIHGGNGMLNVTVLQRTGFDWAYGNWKGECSGAATNGVDPVKTQLFQGFANYGVQYTNAILCTNSNAKNGWTVNKFDYQILDITNRNDQRGSWQNYGDWAPNTYKALCADGYAVTGIAQTPTKYSSATKVLCSKISVRHPSSCSTVINDVYTNQFSDWWGWSVNEYYGDATYVGQDWNYNHNKASCPVDTYVAGISAHGVFRSYAALLCCN